MLRLTCVLAAASATLLLALPAAAESGRAASGVLVSVTTTQVTVRSAHATTRCAVGADSPSVGGYANGDRVQVACRRVGDHFVLAKIRHLPTAGSAVTGADTAPVTFGGVVTALSADSVSLHDGNRDLTCTVGVASPSTATLKVGLHARVVCAGGVLVSFEVLTLPPAITTGHGAVSALSTDSITVHNAEHGDTTCSLGTRSPSVSGVHVGDLVGFACSGGTLIYLAKITTSSPTPAPAPAAPATVGYGVITLLSTGSLTIHNTEHGDLSCTLTEHSPSLDGFRVGDQVKIGCSDGGGLIAVARY